MHYVHNCNFDSIPIKAKAVKTSYKELGEHPAVSRGKMTKRKVSWGREKDSELICREKTQTMISDVMEISKELFLLTLLVPLELTLLSGLADTKEEPLGGAIQA